jgi:phage shock protein PspC (stress-responsive transcriptional regulator)
MTEQQQFKRLVRVQKDRKIAGVCAGFGAYFNLDPTLVRLLWIVLVLAGGAGILLYLIAWIIMPLEVGA